MSKKTFKDNPALSFFSKDATDGSEQQEAPSKAGQDAERRSRRLNLLATPQLVDDLTKIAHMQQSSVNNLINVVMEAYRDEQAETIKRHDEIFMKGEQS